MDKKIAHISVITLYSFIVSPMNNERQRPAAIGGALDAVARLLRIYGADLRLSPLDRVA